MNQSPRITVLMCAYDAAETIGEAIESILAQSWQDFQFVIVDDGSQDWTSRILSKFNDPRLKIITNDTNIGLTRSLNRGLDVSSGEFIARQDADDISYPERLMRQFEFLNTRRDVAVVGTFYKERHRDGRPNRTVFMPQNHREISDRLLYDHCIAHPTVMMRRSCIEDVGNYDSRYLVAQDRALWLRLAERFHLSNFPEVLCELSVRSDSVTGLQRIQQHLMSRQSGLEALDRKKIRFSEKAVARFFWQQALLDIELDNIESASRYLYDIGDAGDNVGQDLDWLAKIAAHWAFLIERNADSSTIDSGITFLNILFALLPESLIQLNTKRGWMEGQLMAACAFDAYYDGKRSLVRQNAFKAWLLHGDFRRNRGIFSIFFRSLIPGDARTKLKS